MAEKRPKISILLPSLNARRFLEPRVSSLLTQTFSNWEAIVLDSHSTDGTWEYFESVAKTDSRFRLNQIPREGLYPALNRGLSLATGEFLCIAPCDDTMSPEFLAEMTEILERCPHAGIAACDCLLINQDGLELRAEHLADRLSKRPIEVLLGSGEVRTCLPPIKQSRVNYRPAPHDCLLHFAGRSIYLSLTQLLIRMSLAKETGPFETNVGSTADFGWLVRLTSATGSVHLPKKLATWRFHGDQLSLKHDERRVNEMKKMCQNILPAIYRTYPGLLKDGDDKLLGLPFNMLLAHTRIQRFGYWLEAFASLCLTSLIHPIRSLRILYGSGFRSGIVANFEIASILFRNKILPRDLDKIS